MQDGDISNEVASKFLFVFEGLIARPPEGADAAKAKVNEKLRRWKSVVELWDFDTRMIAVLWDLIWRSKFNFDIVTFKDQGFAEALETKLDRMNVPYGTLWFTKPETLARELAMMPNVIRVFHALENHGLTFGQRGRYVGDPNTFDPRMH